MLFLLLGDLRMELSIQEIVQLVGFQHNLVIYNVP